MGSSYSPDKLKDTFTSQLKIAMQPSLTAPPPKAEPKNVDVKQLALKLEDTIKNQKQV